MANSKTQTQLWPIIAAGPVEGSPDECRVEVQFVGVTAVGYVRQDSPGHWTLTRRTLTYRGRAYAHKMWATTPYLISGSAFDAVQMSIGFLQYYASIFDPDRPPPSAG